MKIKGKDVKGYWLARSKDGILTMHVDKPRYSDGADLWKSSSQLCVLPRERHSIVTYENSPVEVYFVTE